MLFCDGDGDDLYSVGYYSAVSGGQWCGVPGATTGVATTNGVSR